MIFLLSLSTLIVILKSLSSLIKAGLVCDKYRKLSQASEAKDFFILIKRMNH